METELWPELMTRARRLGIELVLVNARLSAKSLDAGGMFRAVLSRTLACFDRILARSDADRDALIRLGAAADRIDVIGNLKTRSVTTQATTRLVERDYLLLASSHTGEERAFVAARPASLHDRLLVIAPRHPDRSAEIQSELKALEIDFAVRSLDQSVTASTAVYLADTLGELAALMAHAELVVMGGSFDQTGGHNLLEPAALGCAIITGPSDSNIRNDIAMLGSGIRQVDDIDACWRVIQQLLDDPDARATLGQAAKAQLASQPDILQNYLDALAPYLKTSVSK